MWKKLLHKPGLLGFVVAYCLKLAEEEETAHSRKDGSKLCFSSMEGSYHFPLEIVWMGSSPMGAVSLRISDSSSTMAGVFLLDSVVVDLPVSDFGSHLWICDELVVVEMLDVPDDVIVDVQALATVGYY
jgi:hypothetical protein